jgi:hypothetical protein
MHRVGIFDKRGRYCQGVTWLASRLEYAYLRLAYLFWQISIKSYQGTGS